MMIRLVVTILALVVIAPQSRAEGDDLSSKLRLHFQNRMIKESVSPDGLLENKPGVDHAQLRTYFHRSASSATPGGYLSVGVDRLYGIERYEVSPLMVMMQTAEFGASAALFASAIGTTLGAWDEDTSWALIGAAAAAGALWGTTKTDDPAWRIRYRWEP